MSSAVSRPIFEAMKQYLISLSACRACVRLWENGCMQLKSGILLTPSSNMYFRRFWQIIRT